MAMSDTIYADFEVSAEELFLYYLNELEYSVSEHHPPTLVGDGYTVDIDNEFENMYAQEACREHYGFSPTVSLYITWEKFFQGPTMYQRLSLPLLTLMNDFKGDMVYLTNGAVPDFLRSNQKIYLDKRVIRQWGAVFDEFGIAYEVKTLPSL